MGISPERTERLRAGSLPELVLQHLSAGPDFVRAIADVVGARSEAAVSMALRSLRQRGLVELERTEGNRRFYAAVATVPVPVNLDRMLDGVALNLTPEASEMLVDALLRDNTPVRGL